MNLSASGRAERAFSIIEALLAFVILLIALAGLFAVGAVSGKTVSGTGTGSIPFSYGNIKTNSIEVQAVTAAQQYMDQLRDSIQTGSLLPASPLTLVPVSGGQYFVSSNTPAADPGNFVITDVNSCPNVGTSAVFRACTVRVETTSTTNVRILNVPITITSYATEQSQI